LKRYKVRKTQLEGLPRFPVQYQKSRIMVPYPKSPREGKCDACGRSIKRKQISTTHLHHWRYAYKVATVKKSPLLALDNCSELCYSCHRIADALSNGVLFLQQENMWMVIKTALLMPGERTDPKKESKKEKMDWFAKMWLKERKKDRKKVRLTEYI